MNLSIIIPTLNEQSTIADAIERAWALSPLDVIVADGGSEDDTWELAQQKATQVLEAPKGRGPQQNAGAAVAQGDAFLFLHADTWLQAASREQLNVALADDRTQYGAFCQTIEASGTLYRLLEAGNTFRARRLRIPYGDQGLFFRRDFFDSIGGFPDLPLMEELRLMRQLRQQGHSPTILPGPIHVSARRWQKRGVVRQTLLNWSLVWKDRKGVPAKELAAAYGNGRSNGKNINTSTGK